MEIDVASIETFNESQDKDQGSNGQGDRMSEDGGDHDEEEVEVVYEGPPLEMGFNARYLIEALNVIDTDEVVMELRDEGSPGIIKPLTSKDPSYQLCIIMPMRI